MNNIGSKHVVNIMIAYKDKDLLTIIKIVRQIIKEPEFKEKIISLLDDISILYKNNEKNSKEIIECFLLHCNQDSIDLLNESFGMAYDLFKLLKDNEINKKMDKIKEYFIDNLKYAETLLSKNSTKKSEKKPKKKTKKN
jgi:hypothetical protein